MRAIGRGQGERIKDLQALMLVILVNVLVLFGCTLGPGGLMVRKEIRDIRKRDVGYVLIGDSANTTGFRQSGRGLGTSYLFISTPDVNLYNLKPLRSAGDLEHFLEKTKNDGFH